jgi:NADH:ubiquinone reductase (non-electrogenic)
VSPRNYFLFTPLLPSCTVGTIEHRSIMEPIRNFLRHKKAAVKYYEAEATKIDYEKRIVYINDDSEIKGDVSATEVPFDMLVIGVGAENATFGESSRASVILTANGAKASLVCVNTVSS